MCGIVGYVGYQNPRDVIISGLRKLEYRGYDSAGVAILHDSKTKRIRAPGKLKALEDRLASEIFNGHAGIGHTRWATHGVPSERNAHPHQVKDVSIVHNGIIENYMELREELLAGGAKLSSDTDSELVAHLISNELIKAGGLRAAVMKILPRLKGAFSIVAFSETQPDLLVAFKDGPPLVVGLGAGSNQVKSQGASAGKNNKNENFVASDVQALLQYTNKFIYLGDQEIVELQSEKCQVFDSKGNLLKKEIVEISWSPQMIEKQGFDHFMLKEIYEQPRAVAAALEANLNLTTQKIDLKSLGINEAELKKIGRVFIVACGTSFYAGSVGKYLIEQLAKLPVEVEIASEFRYREPVIPKGSLLITISQSGETADTLAALRMAKDLGVLTLSICNVPRSTIDREAKGRLFMEAGPEIGVASTKAFTSTLMVLNCLSVYLGRIFGHIDEAQEQEIVRALLSVPSQMEVVLAYDKYFEKASDKLNQFKGFLYMGRGVSYPIAMEGALKLKELAYLHAEGYAAGEMKHGPLALIDERMVTIMLAPSDKVYEKTISNLEEVRARGGKIISIGTGENERLKSISEYYLSLPKAHWMTNPILSVIPLQLMAYHLACHLGHDVDQPRNLAKSVTVE